MSVMVLKRPVNCEIKAAFFHEKGNRAIVLKNLYPELKKKRVCSGALAHNKPSIYLFSETQIENGFTVVPC